MAMMDLVGGRVAGGPVEPSIAALPKADLHVHAETEARLDRLLAHRHGREPFDWCHWARQLVRETAPGMPRLVRMGSTQRLDSDTAEALDAEPDTFIARMAALLEE